MDIKRIHWLQHVPFEGLGCIEGWARDKGLDCTRTSFFEEWVLPSVDDVDWLVVMGGPMSVGDDSVYPWLVEEKRFIAECIEKGKKVVGICLGAQLIAEVMGGNVYPGSHREIGWHPVRITEEGSASILTNGLPTSFTAFHWHGDTFDIPEGCTHLAESDACVNQAFEYEGRVLGLQFHLESSRESIEALIKNCAFDLNDSEFVQDASYIRAQLDQTYTLNNLANQLLNNMYDG